MAGSCALLPHRACMSGWLASSLPLPGNGYNDSGRILLLWSSCQWGKEKKMFVCKISVRLCKWICRVCCNYIFNLRRSLYLCGQRSYNVHCVPFLSNWIEAKTSTPLHLYVVFTAWRWRRNWRFTDAWLSSPSSSSSPDVTLLDSRLHPALHSLRLSGYLLCLCKMSLWHLTAVWSWGIFW